MGRLLVAEHVGTFLSLPITGVLGGLSITPAVIRGVPGPGDCPSLSFLRAGPAHCDSVSLKEEKRGGARLERGRGEVTAAGGKRWPYPILSARVVFWGAVLQAALSAMELVFQDIAGQLCSSCRAGIFDSPYSILPFPVPGVMLGSETWLCLPCPLIPTFRVYNYAQSHGTSSPSLCLWAAGQDVGLNLSQTRQESACRLCSNGLAPLAGSDLLLVMERWLYLGAGAEESLQD